MSVFPLQKKTAVIVGMGGLGSPLALTLVRAGVGRLTIVDPDCVELSNLHRQILFDEANIGRPKVLVAAERLRQEAPQCQIIPIQNSVETSNAAAILCDHDVICEGTDTLTTKFIANDAAMALNTPIVIAGALGLQGQVMTVVPGLSACYRCVFESMPYRPALTCSQTGVLGSVVGFVAGRQAAEALSILREKSLPFAGKLWMYDALRDSERRVDVRRRLDCDTCGHLPWV